MTETRKRIEDHVDSTPGIHFSALVRALDLATGQTQYHIKRLRKSGSIIVERRYGRTHYYPTGYDEFERAALALLRRETAGDIVAVLVSEGSLPPDEVADTLGIARSTLEWHLDRFVEEGLIEKQRDPERRVTLVLVRPEATARLLEIVRPSTAERLVDRYTRLFDGLLSE